MFTLVFKNEELDNRTRMIKIMHITHYVSFIIQKSISQSIFHGKVLSKNVKDSVIKHIWKIWN